MLKKIIAFLMLALTAASCSKDDTSEPDFDGTDNYIVSFAVAKDGVTYQALISGTDMTVSVPYTVSLTGAEVEYVLSENSVITPDPKSISAWDEEWQFIVTSYGEEDRVYTYIPVHTNITTAGDVHLSTQAEADAFLETGIKSIKGNLVIGNKAGSQVRDLSGLINLTEVTGSIIIGEGYLGDSLSGLAHLELAGSLRLGSMRSASGNTTTEAFALPSLREIHGDLILHGPAVRHIDLPALEKVTGNVFVRSSALASFDAVLLEYVEEDVYFSGELGGTADAGMEILYLPALTEVIGNIELVSLPSLDYLSAPGLKSVQNITVSSCAVMTSAEFPVLRTVGDISIASCPKFGMLTVTELTECRNLTFTSLAAAFTFTGPSLTHVQGNLSLVSLTHKPTLGDFASVRSISGTLLLSGLQKVESFSDMANLRSVGNLTLADLRGLTELDLSRIAFNGGTLSLSANTFRDLDGFTTAETFDGEILIPSVVARTEYKTFTIDGLKTLDGSFHSNAVSGTVTRFSFPDLEMVNGDLTVVNTTAGNANTGFREILADNLKEVKGSLILRILPYLELDLPSLTRVGKQLYMSGTTSNGPLSVNLPALEEVGDGEPFDETYSSYAFHHHCIQQQEVEYPKLKTVNGSVYFQAYTAASTKTRSIRVPALESVYGHLDIGLWTAVSTSLQEVDFSGLRTVSGKITVSNLGGLSDFSTFAGVVATLDESRWAVSGCGANPSWDDMMNLYGK